ncbi:MAG: SH3 domain-containing protein [Bacteroidetes bacterium]|jgi:hypothetical protein|nr:SH3 domain-containing protein [Bacteroidota bacterium]
MKESYGLATESMVPVRAEATEKSEMMHQLLFGETVTINHQQDNWLRIKIISDSYEGWVDAKMITYIEDAYRKLWHENKLLVVQKELALMHLNGTVYTIYAGSEMATNEKLLNRIGFKTYNNVSENAPFSLNNFIEKITSIYLNTPYLWGGRTPYGIDCSGFTQVAFKLAGIGIPRDASQQAIAPNGKEVISLTDSHSGDLAFFDNKEGNITHVGILLGSNKIMHASGRVRIDSIDHYGIYNDDKGIYTHGLRLIRRFW